MPGIPIVPEYVTSFLGTTAQKCEAFVFAGPVCVAGDEVVGLENVLTHPDYKPRDVNGFVWWIDQHAPNALSILNHSHAVFYYYPEHDLVDLTVETCNPFDRERVLEAVYEHWLPIEGDMQYDFKVVRQGTPYTPSEQARIRAGYLRDLRQLLSRPHFGAKETLLIEGRRFEQLLYDWKQTQSDDLSDFLTTTDKKLLQDLYALYEGQLEQLTASEIIAGRSDETSFPYYERYARLTAEEMRIAGINQDANVGFIGGGWLPISAILYARRGTRVTIYEKEPDRAETSRQAITKLHHSDRISVVCAEAEREMRHHDIYVIAALAQPKAAIVANLRRQAIAGDRVLLRTTHHDNILFYGAELGWIRGFRGYHHHSAAGPDDVISFQAGLLVPTLDYCADKGAITAPLLEQQTYVGQLR